MPPPFVYYSYIYLAIQLAIQLAIVASCIASYLLTTLLKQDSKHPISLLSSTLMASGSIPVRSASRDRNIDMFAKYSGD